MGQKITKVFLGESLVFAKSLRLQFPLCEKSWQKYIKVGAKP